MVLLQKNAKLQTGALKIFLKIYNTFYISRFHHQITHIEQPNRTSVRYKKNQQFREKYLTYLIV